MKATTAERLTPTEFVDVARSIAKGHPLQWLPLALEHFSPRIGEGPADTLWFVKKTVDAIDHLLLALHVYEHLPYGFAGECKDARAVLALLPGIKKDFERGMRKRTGRRPDIGKIVCAAVMIETWNLFHDSVEPHSEEFREACGGQGDWRGRSCELAQAAIENALAMDREWISKLIIVQNTH